MKNLWINYEEWKYATEYRKYQQSKWWAEIFYDIPSWQYPEFEEFQNCDKQRGIPLKDSSEILKGNGNSTLLSLTEGSNLLQNKTMFIPSGGTQATHMLSEKGILRGERLCPWVPRTTKDWVALC